MTTLLPRALSLRSHATTTEIRELADILVQMLEAEQRAEQGRAELAARFSEPVLFDPDKPFKCCEFHDQEPGINSRHAIEGAPLKGSE